MQHLPQQQRCHLEELMSSGFSCREISEQLGIHASTVSREWRRNSVRGRFNYIVAKARGERAIQENQKRAGRKNFGWIMQFLESGASLRKTQIGRLFDWRVSDLPVRSEKWLKKKFAALREKI